MLSKKDIEEEGWRYMGFGAHTDFYTRKEGCDELELWYDEMAGEIEIYGHGSKMGYNGICETKGEFKEILRKLGFNFKTRTEDRG